MSSRRKGRTPSPEERQLWEKVTADVTPIVVPRRARARADAVEPPSAPDPAEAEAQTAPRRKGVVSKTALRPTPPPKQLVPPPPPLAPLEPRQRRRLVRGTRAIDGRIDLHGLTQAEAHVRLRGFLSQAQAQGSTVVLVITGKGGPGGSLAADGRGILRRVVPQWLSFAEFRGLVVGFEEAHTAHGGAGALYVRIRRSGRGSGR
ncbi:Smr/MutS family protein [Stappia sp.]|jgi:DNA-nicking Smr family endonuclease|uniref:Smr/MutS family protein n=1 Tax=Stappia sp. TaxID=1870903 RepID=UPI003A99DF71